MSQGGQCSSALRRWEGCWAPCGGPQPLQEGTQEGLAQPTCQPPVGSTVLRLGPDRYHSGRAASSRKERLGVTRWELLVERAEEGRGSTTAGPTVRGRASRLGRRKGGSATHPLPRPSAVPNRSTFACPYCGARNLDQQELVKHCVDNHRSDPNRVVSPPAPGTLLPTRTAPWTHPPPPGSVPGVSHLLGHALG